SEPPRAFPRIVPTTQALGPNEQMFEAQHRFTATNVTRVIALEGALSPREIRQALRALHARHPLLRARIVAGHFVYESAPPLSRTLHERRPSAHTSAYGFRNLSREQTTELIAAARAEATTVTGALMAAALLAVREVRPRTPRLALSVPINLRPRLPGHELAPE